MRQYEKGFFGIGVYHPQHECNVGTLFRSALAFEADFLFTIGRQYKLQPGDTPNSTKTVPYFSYKTLEEFKKFGPKDCRLQLVEISDKAVPLPRLTHYHRTAYLLGNEGGGLPKDLLDNYPIVSIPTTICLNLAVAGSIVMYDRISKSRT